VELVRLQHTILVLVEELEHLLDLLVLLRRDVLISLSKDLAL